MQGQKQPFPRDSIDDRLSRFCTACGKAAELRDGFCAACRPADYSPRRSVILRVFCARCGARRAREEYAFEWADCCWNRADVDPAYEYHRDRKAAMA